MGKSRKSRKSKVCRDDPIGLDSAVSELTEGGGDNGNVTEAASVDNMVNQLQSVNPEDRICGCHSLARLSLSSAQFRQQALEMKVARVCGPLALDSDPMVRLAAVGALNNLSSTDPDTAEVLVEQDIMTPLTAMLTTFYPTSWTPSTLTKKPDLLTRCLLEAMGLLWNLVESSQAAVNMFNSQALIHPVLGYLDLARLPSNLVQASLSVLAAVCDSNPPASEVVLAREQELLDLQQNKAASLNIRITVGVVLLNIHRADIYSHTSFPGITETVSDCLGLDARQCISEYSSVSPLEEENGDGEMEVEDNDNKTEDKKLQECKDMIKAQYSAMEVLVNLADMDDGEDDWDDEEESEDSGDEILEDQSSGADEKLSEAHPAFCEAAKAHNFVQSVLSLASDLPENVKQILLSSSRGRGLMSQLNSLRARAFLCLASLADSLGLDDLGGLANLQLIWTSLGTLCFSQQEGEGEVVEAATSAMRSVTRKVCGGDLGLARQVVGVVRSEDLAGMMAVCSISEKAGLRVNIVHILGDVAGLAATNIQEKSSCEVLSQLVTWLVEAGARDPDLRVVAEALDKLMDVLSEDDSDEIFVQLKLLTKLKQLLPSLKVKLEQQKRDLGSGYPIIQMAKTNLQRFIKYKEKRPIIARSK